MTPRIRTYNEVQELDSDLPDQIAAQDARVAARLSTIGRVVGVMSGKGGVGKSLVASLLATGLARRGHEVGLIDADLNGPSALRMLGVEPGALEEGDDGVVPAVAASGVRLMSMGLLLDADAALAWSEPIDAGFVWRGAQERGALREFLSDVAWGPLDVLIVDLPPGTQRLAELHGLVPGLAGLVGVTIPSGASRDAVARSLDLVGKRGMDVLGLVENMSGIVCSGCGERTPLHHGNAGMDLANQFEVPLLGRIPFDVGLGAAAESGDLVSWLGSPSGRAAQLEPLFNAVSGLTESEATS